MYVSGQLLNSSIELPTQIDCTLCVPSTGPNSNQIPMNTNTVVTNNGATRMLDGGGVIENNYESEDVKEQMVDPANYDFRQLPYMMSRISFWIV